MEITIRITTPPGMAKQDGTAEKLLKPLLMGIKKVKYITEYIEAENQILWHVTVDPRNYVRIVKNVSRFKTVMKLVLDMKVRKKAFKMMKLSTEEQEKQLTDLLVNGTTIEIVNRVKIR